MCLTLDDILCRCENASIPILRFNRVKSTVTRRGRTTVASKLPIPRISNQPFIDMEVSSRRQRNTRTMTKTKIMAGAVRAEVPGIQYLLELSRRQGVDTTNCNAWGNCFEYGDIVGRAKMRRMRGLWRTRWRWRSETALCRMRRWSWRPHSTGSRPWMHEGRCIESSREGVKPEWRPLRTRKVERNHDDYAGAARCAALWWRFCVRRSSIWIILQKMQTGVVSNLSWWRGSQMSTLHGTGFRETADGEDGKTWLVMTRSGRAMVAASKEALHGQPLKWRVDVSKFIWCIILSVSTVLSWLSLQSDKMKANPKSKGLVDEYYV